LRRKTTKLVELRSLNPDHKDRVLPLKDVDFVSRIVWSSQ
jgi:phage repressor protein C with HTH and peptisase S24 domain